MSHIGGISSSVVTARVHRTPVQTGGGAGQAQKRKRKVDHRVLSDEPITPKPIKLPNYTHDANPRPRRTSQI